MDRANIRQAGWLLVTALGLRIATGLSGDSIGLVLRIGYYLFLVLFLLVGIKGLFSSEIWFTEHVDRTIALWVSLLIVVLLTILLIYWR